MCEDSMHKSILDFAMEAVEVTLYEDSVNSAIPALQGGNKRCFSIPFPSEFMTTFHSLWHQYPTQKEAKVSTPEDGTFQLSQEPLKKPCESFLCLWPVLFNSTANSVFKEICIYHLLQNILEIFINLYQ